MKHIFTTIIALTLLTVTSASAGILLKKKTMTYDLFNRQTSWTQSVPDGQGGWTVEKSESSTYRGDKWHRTSSTSGGTSTNFLYDDNNVIADIVNGSVVRSYVTPMIDQNVSIRNHATSSTYYYNQDERQSVQNLTDSTGAVVQNYGYTAYGDKVDLLTKGNVDQRYTFTGRELNVVSCDYYFRYRMYDAQLGGFLSRDPMGYVDGMSAYSGYFAQFVSEDPFGNARKKRKPKKPKVTNYYIFYVPRANYENKCCEVMIRHAGMATEPRITCKTNKKCPGGKTCHPWGFEKSRSNVKDEKNGDAIKLTIEVWCACQAEKRAHWVLDPLDVIIDNQPGFEKPGSGGSDQIEL